MDATSRGSGLKQNTFPKTQYNEVSLRTLVISKNQSNATGTRLSPTSPKIGLPLGLGNQRRPSENLSSKFSNMKAEIGTPLDTNKMKMENELASFDEFSPPNKRFMMRNDRPISDDSIGTKTSELFSSPSSDYDSGRSSIEHEFEALGISKSNVRDRNSTISEGNSTLMMNQSNIDIDIHTPNNGDVLSVSSASEKSLQSSPLRTKLIFKNNADGSATTLKQSSYRHANGSEPILQQISRPYQLNETNTGYNQSKSFSNGGPITAGTTNTNIYGHSNSTTAILPNKIPLTASQRYRLRKEQTETSLRKSIKKKERFYDEQDPVVDLQEGDIDDSLIWNIPMASFSTSAFLTSSGPKHKHVMNHQPNRLQSGPRDQSELNVTPQKDNNPSMYNKNLKTPDNSFANEKTTFGSLDFFQMPTSPIPGINRVSDFQYIKNTTKNLSDVYIQSSSTLSKSKLTERTNSADVLPIELKQASDEGLEDLILISKDKLDMMSHSRPSWLPPKDVAEKRAHEKQISKSMSMASIDQLDRTSEREQRMIRDETNKQKFILLLDRDITRKSSLKSLKKMIWETALTADVRSKVYSEVLQGNAKIITSRYLESYEQVLQLINKMDFPKNKELEIDQSINRVIRTKRNGEDEISKDLMLMLQLKSISSAGLLPGDELLFHHFLSDESFGSLKDVWEAVNLIQLACFNDVCQEQYDEKIVSPKSIMGSYLLRTDDFKDEFNQDCLNFNTWWNVLERVDHTLFMWIMDIIVVHNGQPFSNSPVNPEMFAKKPWEYYRSAKVISNYKILLSFSLNILLNYHFGFMDMKSLATQDDSNFCIPIPMTELIDMENVNSIFVRKWLHYYKKF
ncbi:Sbe22p KNAG_0B04300 [Huiozyma naganishii CBS 8797]|uniref:Protein SBE22 n=1 Tax=Huiozyma naganishii (strain ATCC MYA-139 / BCRC 22969 / CBS 8797 / KCTC 17520 / NBRC 10181 / NCYC 3082 / Yp74L-3) TaxID=1071383 RepID=J7R223_HUIN7|nr:hypothetical protein KNAG_0B04300 [Kazachstania naganishii CBS 8797]CCK68865.1 hypothetical protein KNAG_0B04300 [Kazachstania naganishii CBS 8797]